MGTVEATGVMRRGLTGLAAAVVVAAGLAAGIGGWRYWHDAGSALVTTRTLVTARNATDSDLFRMVPDAEDRRLPAPYPREFERQFPLIAVLPPSAASPVLPQAALVPKATTIHRDCAARCQAAQALALVVPPRRPEGLRGGAPILGGLAAAGVDLDGAVAPEASAEAPAKLLGIPLLPFAPASRAVLRRVADIGEGVSETFAGLIDARP